MRKCRAAWRVVQAGVEGSARPPGESTVPAILTRNRHSAKSLSHHADFYCARDFGEERHGVLMWVLAYTAREEIGTDQPLFGSRQCRLRGAKA